VMTPISDTLIETRPRCRPKAGSCGEGCDGYGGRPDGHQEGSHVDPFSALPGVTLWCHSAWSFRVTGGHHDDCPGRAKCSQ